MEYFESTTNMIANNKVSQEELGHVSPTIMIVAWAFCINKLSYPSYRQFFIWSQVLHLSLYSSLTSSSRAWNVILIRLVQRCKTNQRVCHRFICVELERQEQRDEMDGTRWQLFFDESSKYWGKVCIRGESALRNNGTHQPQLIRNWEPLVLISESNLMAKVSRSWRWRV